MKHKGAAQSHGQNSDKSASWNIITFQVFDIFASVEFHALIFFHCAVLFLCKILLLHYIRAVASGGGGGALAS